MTQPPTPPTTPNFNPGVGRLVTDRYDFQTHVNGTTYLNANGDVINFRHQANQIDVVPTVTIAGTGYTNVQTALQAISANITPPAVPNATASVLGLIQLGGDLAGIGSSATAPKVGGLQGRPISNATPSTGAYLVWSGSNWGPASPVITLSGDVTGPTSSNLVTSISSPCIVQSTVTAQYGGAFIAGTNGYIRAYSAGALTLYAANDFVQYASAHTRSICNTFTVFDLVTDWQVEGFALKNNSTSSDSIYFKLDNLHNGATLESLTVSFEVGQAHTQLPAALPYIAVKRINFLNPNINQYLSATGGSPTPVDYTHYYNGGNPQQFSTTFIGSGGDNVIDTSSYAYFGVIQDEGGTGSLPYNVYDLYSVNYGNILNDQFP